jgi:YhcH/YjgK/YiaL family protein
MIFDTLANADFYRSLHPGFEKAFEFLKRADLATMEKGTYEIDGKNVYAMVQGGPGKKSADARLEAHDRYIDIQYLIEGNERIGWKPRRECITTSSAYNSEKDIVFYGDVPQTTLAFVPGSFALFYPFDAHAPMISDGEVRKCVVKVKVV